MNDFNLRNASDRLDSLITLYNDGRITSLELMDNILHNCASDDEALAVLAQRMATHKEESVRHVATDIQDIIERRANRVMAITEIEKTSPLHPGVKLRLDGGYESNNPWWLNGNDSYRATFVRFASRRANEMPVALVELEQEINMVEGSGLQHHGKYALLKLKYVADWGATETVTVHLVECFPHDVVAFYQCHPLGSEIESHATYRIATANGA